MFLITRQPTVFFEVLDRGNIVLMMSLGSKNEICSAAVRFLIFRIYI